MLTQSKQTVLVIANATALATAIVHKVSGNEVANTLNGVTLGKTALANLIASRIHANFSNYTAKATQ